MFCRTFAVCADVWVNVVVVVVRGWEGGRRGASCLFTRIDAGLAACHAATISPHTNESCLFDGRQIITLLI